MMPRVREWDEKTLAGDATARTIAVGQIAAGEAGPGDAAGRSAGEATLAGDATARTMATGQTAGELVGATARTMAMGQTAGELVGATARTMAMGQTAGGVTLAGATAQTMAAGLAGPAAEEVERGAVIDRYVVLTRLGAGGMGVVYAAYDPELDRKVALKLLHAQAGGESSLGRARLVREAQALARLSHPHVVAIHDVGTLGDRVWLAMEYVDGVTFGTWLEGQRRRWPEVLQVMRAVGEGLAAAHEAGLVHRDLKPDNVMIGRDGRVRVMDFGLARAAGEGEVGGGPAARAVMLDVTQVGAVMGTPAYMSPEQWRGEQADARADQFAFCVTLWEAVHGQRPFAGETLPVLAGAITRGELRAPPRGRDAPVWLRRVLQRGLQVDPARRYPSMRALLEALARGQGRGRRLRVGLGLGLLAAVAGAVPLSQAHDRARREAACVAAGGEIAAVWNEAARAGLTQALRAAAGHRGAAIGANTLPWIDRWAASWFTARVEGCRAAEVEGAVTPELAAQARACLAERREELAGLLEVLVEDPKVAMQRAVSAAASLTPVATCADPAALARRPAPPDDPAALLRLGALRRELLRIQGLLASGRYADGLTRAEALRAGAVALGQASLVGEAELLVGMHAAKLQKFDVAVPALGRAFVACGAQGLDELAARAAIELVFVVGSVQGRHEVGQAWAQAAELFVARLGEREVLLGSAYLNAMASFARSRGDLDEAAQAFERALAIREAALGPDHPDRAASLGNLAITYEMLGRGEAAQAQLERALELAERTLGETHLLTMQLVSNLAVLKLNRGALDEAQALEERGLRLRQQVFKAGHPQIGGSLANLATILQQRGDLDGARRMYAQALAIHERAFGRDHALVADGFGNLALIARLQGRLAEAQALEETALAIRERTLGPDHLDVAWSLDNLSAIQSRRGDLEQARALALRAVALRERLPGSRELATSLTTLAYVELNRGEHERARPLFVRALAIRERVMEPDSFVIAETLNGLADVEVEAGALDRALELATRSREIWVKSRSPDDPELARPLLLIGEVELRRGRPREALALFERALALRGAAAPLSVDRADAEFAVARALVALPAGAGADPARAKTLATQALAAYSALPGGAPPTRDTIAAWLRRRGSK